jgi:hypothetical protein
MTFGGASVLGTGAFTSVEAERSVSVDVVGDADAFLGLRPCPHDGTVQIEQNEDDEGDGGEDDPAVAFPPSHAVVEQNGRIRIDLTSHNNKLANEGITENSVWRFPNALEITNQGTQPVCVDLCIEDSEGDECAVPTVGDVENEDFNFNFGHGAPAVVLYTTDDQGKKKKFGQDTDTTESPLFLPRGESECIGFDVRTFVSEEELSNMTLRIRADARTDCGGSSEDGTAGDAGVLNIENAETYGESNGQNGDGNSRIKFDLSASETVTLTGLEIRSASSNPGNGGNGNIDKIRCDNGSTIEFDGEDEFISGDHMSEFPVNEKIPISSNIEIPSQDGPVQIRVGKFIGSSGNSKPKNMTNGSVSCVFYYRSDEQGEERSQSINLTEIPNNAE